MRLLMLLSLLAASSAQAQQVVLPPSDAKAKNIVAAGDAQTERFAEWQDGGAIRIALGKEADAAPASASRYEQRRFGWPTGELRVLHFKKGAPVLHQITFETELYVQAGSAEVGVNGTQVAVKAGDAVFLPSGALRSAKAKTDLTVLLFTVGTTAKNAKAALIRGDSLKPTPAGSWVRDGKTVVARDAAELKTAPPGASLWTTKLYQFEGNAIRVLTFKDGGATGPGVTAVDAIAYVAQGKIRRNEGDETALLSAGGVAHLTTGLKGNWAEPDHAVFVHTSAPVPKGMAPTKPQ